MTVYQNLLTYLFTPWSRVLLENLTGLQLVKKLPAFYGIPQGSLPPSQVSATCPYPEPTRSSPYPHIPLPEYPSQYPPIYTWVSQLVFFPQVSPPKPYTPLLSHIHATCPAHLILLDVITRTIFGEEYRLLSSPLFSFLRSPVTPSLLGPNILLNTLFSNTLPTFLPQCERPSFTTYKTTGRILFLNVLDGLSDSGAKWRAAQESSATALFP